MNQYGDCVAEQVVVDADTATDRRVCQIESAQPIDLPRPADAVNGGEYPRRHEDFRIDGIAFGLSIDGLDLRRQRLPIEPVDISPGLSRRMIGRQQLIKSDGSPFYLPKLWPFDLIGFRCGSRYHTFGAATIC